MWYISKINIQEWLNKSPQSTLEAVAAFCKNDEHSRVMPGKRDCVMLQETCKSKNN